MQIKNITPEISFTVTKYCNQNCSYCLAKSFRVSKNIREVFDIKQFDILKEIPMCRVSLFGGEPTLLANFSEVYLKLNDFKNNKIIKYFEILTNGTFDIDEINKLPLNGLFYISIHPQFMSKERVIDLVKNFKHQTKYKILCFGETEKLETYIDILSSAKKDFKLTELYQYDYDLDTKKWLERINKKYNINIDKQSLEKVPFGRLCFPPANCDDNIFNLECGVYKNLSPSEYKKIITKGIICPLKKCSFCGGRSVDDISIETTLSKKIIEKE